MVNETGAASAAESRGRQLEAYASSHRILIVDDEAYIVRTLEQLMRRNGYSEIRSTTDSGQAVALFEEFAPDLVLVDLQMEPLDGYALIREWLRRVPEGHFLPIVVISGDLAPEAEQMALQIGASDFIQKPFSQVEVCLRVGNLLQLRDLTTRLEERVAERTRELQLSELEMAKRLALTAELCDYYDAGHVQRVGRTSALIARQLGLPEQHVELIRWAAPLHDIGKVAIPDAILLKPGVLTPEEWGVMKTHTTVGAQMLAGSRSPILQLAEEIALYHHENWDGTGYTPGLAGEDIPLGGRIVTVADVFDALSHPRPYKRAWSVGECVGWMQTMRGTKFDPRVLDCLLAVLQTEDLTQLDAEADDASALPAVTAGTAEPLPLL